MANLVYSAPGTTVDTVVVGGEVVIEGSHPVQADEDDLRAGATEAARRIFSHLDGDRLVTLRWPVVPG